MTDAVQRAAQLRAGGRPHEARATLEALLASEPDHAAALNSLGLLNLAEGDAEQAAVFLQRATVADPTAGPLWLNLAEAHRQRGDLAAEIAALDGALAADPYLIAALLRKAQACERAGNAGQAVRVYRALFSACPDDTGLSLSVRQVFAHGRELVREHADARAADMAASLRVIVENHPDEDFSRVQAYADHLAGLRQVYVQQPTGGHFPFLPALEFFPRHHLPWLKQLEDAFAAIREELLSLWNEGHEGFRPYVAFERGTPVNQWAELNHSPRWSAWFLWKDGVRQDVNCGRCPRTASVVETLPLLDLPGKGPSVMFSILEPRTRIPAHTGSSNVRATVHLPLVVPPGCGFRVGADRREWREGQAWAFDDTIDHEAWNDSDRPRAILIVDAWNPLLTEAERAAVRAIG